MNNSIKYTRQYFPAPKQEMKWMTQNYISKPPVWCSVDLRDGNQALIIPMSLGRQGYINRWEKWGEEMQGK